MGGVGELDHGEEAALPQVRLRGLRFHAISEARCVEHILRNLDAGRGGWVITVNLDHHRRALRDDSYSELCQKASLVVADGMLTVFASRLQGTPLPERVAGSDLISSLSAAAERYGRSIYLLGGSPGSAEGARGVLQRRHPDLRIAGIDCPPMGFEDDADEFERVAQVVVDAAPDIVLVALGSPKQERLIARLRDRLPRAWWLGVGISFSFLSGHVRRAPRWMQTIGFEWLHRLVQEPRRLAWRYLIEGIPFALGVLVSASGQRLRQRSGRRA
jgi:N-acetylglucosaminyldiphosphoundecaprenol N-acetyl-beta-D-mannosaminyltransferase